MLRKTLGFYDSIPTTIELLLLDFKNRCDTDNFKPEDVLKNLSSSFIVPKHNIKSFDESHGHVHDLYILLVFNVIDSFFREFKSLLIDLNGISNWKFKSGNTDLDAFGQIVENTGKDFRKILKDKPEYHLINYFRLYRNAIVHRVFDGDNQFDKSNKYFKTHVEKHLKYFKEIYYLDAPNSSNSIRFDDFLIYTRAVKYYNNLLNDCWYDITSSNLIEHALNDETLSRKFRGYLNARKEKQINPLKSYLRRYFVVNEIDDFTFFIDGYLEMGLGN